MREKDAYNKRREHGANPLFHHRVMREAYGGDKEQHGNGECLHCEVQR